MRTSPDPRSPDRPARAPDPGRLASCSTASRAGRPAAGSRVGPGGDGQAPPGRPGLHPGRPVHDELRLHATRPPRLPRVRRALRRPGEATDTDGCRHHLAPARHAGPVRRGRRPSPPAAPPSGTAASPTARGARCVSEGRRSRRLRRQRLRPGPGRRRRRTQGQPERPVLGRPVGLSAHGAPQGTPGLLLRPVQPAPHHAAVAEDRRLARCRPTAAGAGTSTPRRPGIPGDSGSGFLDADGRAVGTLSTVAIAPLAGSNGLGDLQRELRYAQRHSGIPGLRLVRGTEPFSPVPSDLRVPRSGVGSGPMGARRASASAVVAVVGGVLLVTLLVAWAASIGPSEVLRGDGPERLQAEPSETPALNIPSESDGGPDRSRKNRRAAGRGRDRGRPGASCSWCSGSLVLVALIFLGHRAARWAVADVRRPLSPAAAPGGGRVRRARRSPPHRGRSWTETPATARACSTGTPRNAHRRGAGTGSRRWRRAPVSSGDLGDVVRVHPADARDRVDADSARGRAARRALPRGAVLATTS